jgi:hypothetical protein
VIVERNKRLYASDNIKFMHADAATASLPSADLVLIREVLQHLSNKDVAAVLKNISGKYRFNIITNTVAKDAKKKNVDIPSGSNSRAGLGYGLWLDRAPFDCEIRELGRWSHANRPTELVSVTIVE